MLTTVNSPPRKNRQTAAEVESIKKWADHYITDETHGYLVFAISKRDAGFVLNLKLTASPDTFPRQRLAEAVYRAIIGRADVIDANATDVLPIGDE